MYATVLTEWFETPYTRSIYWQWPMSILKDNNKNTGIDAMKIGRIHGMQMQMNARSIVHFKYTKVYWPYLL